MGLRGSVVRRVAGTGGSDRSVLTETRQKVERGESIWISVAGGRKGLRLEHDHRLEDGSEDRVTFEFDLTDEVEPPPAPGSS